MAKLPKGAPKVYFSLRSPFSWMAVRRLRERVPDARELLDFIPFYEPDDRSAAMLAERGGEFHYVPMSKAKHLYILNDTKRLAARFGYAMKWPVDIDPVWELPHLAWIVAGDLGVQDAYYDAVMAARWERGEDICDPAVLRGVLAGAGLPVEPLLGAPDDDAVRGRGVDALMSMYSDDVFGVPYFKWGVHRFWGLDRLETFLDLLEPALPELRARRAAVAPEAAPLAGLPEPALAAVGAYDRDTAGGCG
ncbi:2-hydroxychromene-2-carboxylate isomerase [Actinokineospora bangkokensis]|uniref:2-hydroxychromene-2-carboxylate isomerase n=1 Tax=Actinokineospora bangkokensis TaxID=1193682 RepID=A0A1Q9LNP6_9PSEU|nr:DsbA family protein [Actinokineospora bangkokensis]OLR93677.1 disulfide bond formation protein DsbA [Actinokineospora bangkokensis]